MIRRFIARTTLVFLGLFFAAVSLATAASKPNIVLITIDSVRADCMSFLGGKGASTPNLNHLATESFVFEHAYAQAPGTVVSHATILTGSYPQSTGLTEIGGMLAASLPYLPDLLKGQGYKTAAFVGSIELDPWNGLAQGFDRGFQSYDAGFRPVIPGDAKPSLTDRNGAEVAAHAIAWLNKNAQSGPFFVWVHINDASAAHASYNAALTAADVAVGKLLAALKAQKVDTNTAVAVVADHGQPPPEITLHDVARKQTQTLPFAGRVRRELDALAWRSLEYVDVERFTSWVEGLPPEVRRLKAILVTAYGIKSVQRVGLRTSVSTAPQAALQTLGGDAVWLVLFAKDFDTRLLTDEFDCFGEVGNGV